MALALKFSPHGHLHLLHRHQDLLLGHNYSFKAGEERLHLTLSRIQSHLLRLWYFWLWNVHTWGKKLSISLPVHIEGVREILGLVTITSHTLVSGVLNRMVLMVWWLVHN